MSDPLVFSAADLIGEHRGTGYVDQRPALGEVAGRWSSLAEQDAWASEPPVDWGEIESIEAQEAIEEAENGCG